MTSDETWRNRIKNTNNPIMKNLKPTPPAQQEHPLNCSTCSFHIYDRVLYCDYCTHKPLIKFRIIPNEMYILNRLGCASHSSRPNASAPNPCIKIERECERLVQDNAILHMKISEAAQAHNVLKDLQDWMYAMEYTDRDPVMQQIIKPRTPKEQP
jgi:hypothetical protein